MDAHAPSIEAYFPVPPAAAPSATDTHAEEVESTPALLVQEPSVPSLTASLLAEEEVFSLKREASRFAVGL
ncbi:MAG: hypothetical protein ACMG6S_25770, partial [Byssovorax sp.]